MSVLTFADLYSVRLSTSDRIKKNKENFEKEESMRKRKLQQQLHLNIKSHIINEFHMNRSNSNRINNNEYVVEKNDYNNNFVMHKSFNHHTTDSSSTSSHYIYNENEGSDSNKRSSVDDSCTVGIIPSFEWRDYLSKNSKVENSDKKNDSTVIRNSNKKLSKNAKKNKNNDDDIDYDCYKNDYNEKYENNSKIENINNSNSNSKNKNNRDGLKKEIASLHNNNTKKNNKNNYHNNNDNNNNNNNSNNTKNNNINNRNKTENDDDYISNFEFTKGSPYRTNEKKEIKETEKTELISVNDLKRVDALEELPPRLVLAAAAIVILIEDKEQVISKQYLDNFS